MHANTKLGSTANAAIAAIIGPPKTPLTTNVITEMTSPGVYVIQYLVRCEIGIFSRLAFKQISSCANCRMRKESLLYENRVDNGGLSVGTRCSAEPCECLVYFHIVDAQIHLSD